MGSTQTMIQKLLDGVRREAQDRFEQASKRSVSANPASDPVQFRGTK